MKNLLSKCKDFSEKKYEECKESISGIDTKNLISSSLSSAVGAVVGVSAEISQKISSTEAWKSLNEQSMKGLASLIGKAMDSEYLQKGIGSTDSETLSKMTANNHRILDGGHTLSESWKAAENVGTEQGASSFETFLAWGEAYLKDLSSPAGMPIGEWSDNVYAALQNLGISEKTARDLVTVNGSEALSALIGGTTSILAIVMAWKSEDKANFSKAVGSLGIASLISTNPVTGLIALVGLGIGYQKGRVSADGVKKGVFISSSFALTSLLIPGPLLLGVIPAIVLTIYLNKKMDDTRTIEEHLGLLFTSFKNVNLTELWQRSRAIFEEADKVDRDPMQTKRTG